MDLRTVMLDQNIFFFFFPCLANTSWYKWLQWVIFLKGHNVSLAYSLTIHITEGCLQLWAKQWAYCHPHDQASKETTLLVSYRKKGLSVCSNTCTLQLPPKACSHFKLLLDSGYASPAIYPLSVSHHGMIILWLNHFCFLLLWPLHTGAFPNKSTSSSCSEISWSLYYPTFEIVAPRIAGLSTTDRWKITIPNLIISMIICLSS